jgi:hypothetical protein
MHLEVPNGTRNDNRENLRQVGAVVWVGRAKLWLEICPHSVFARGFVVSRRYLQAPDRIKMTPLQITAQLKEQRRQKGPEGNFMRRTICAG